jgi:opacity protein-like surface antigen
MSMLTMVRCGAVAASLLSASALVAQQQPSGITPRSNTRGVALGAHVGGASLSFEGEDAETGAGGGVMLGYGITPMFMVYAGADLAKVTIDDPDFGESSYGLAHLDLGVRLSFANPRRALVPYLNAAFTARSASAEVTDGTQTADLSITGPAFSFGGGVQYFFSPRLALDAGLAISAGKFDKIKLNGETADIPDADDSTTSRLNIGVKFYPQRAR